MLTDSPQSRKVAYLRNQVRGPRLVLGHEAATSQATALPPDVRRWLCPAVKVSLNPGLRPWFGLCPLYAKSRIRGTAPDTYWAAYGGAKPRLTSGGEAVSWIRWFRLPAHCWRDARDPTYFRSEACRFSIDVRNSSGVAARPCTA
jgi:hypothetical protein